MKNTAKLIIGLLMFASFGFAQSVTVTSPANGATVGTPVQFVATANGGPRPVTALRIYVDGISAYTVNNTTGLNTSLALAAGTHSVVVQGWNAAGTVFKSPLTIKVGAGAPPAPPAPPAPAPPAANPKFQSDLVAASNWMTGKTIAPDGAILYGFSYTTNVINPYYSNLAAIGLTKNPTAANVTVVENWMKWYVNHLNWPDKWGLYGTTYDYDYNAGAEVSHVNADSTDSYAATFLSLAWSFYSSGNPTAQSYVKTLSYQLDAIGQVLALTADTDGLTWSKPDYHIKYLMDNCEAYRGLRDLALIEQNAFNNVAKAQQYNAMADKMYNSIIAMYLGGGKWAPYKDALGRLPAPNLATWYADASSQMFPVMQGVIPGTDAKAIATYATFNAAWPGWQNLSFNAQDQFPWVMIADAAAAMGDTARVNTYINNIEAKYVNAGFPWPWYGMEDGWYMRLMSYMQGKRPL